MFKPLIALSSAAIVALAPMTAAPAMAQSSSSSVPKDGSCPTGFKQSGSNCTSSSKVALPKIGSCPTGFRASGNYCVGDGDDYAEVRDGSCPSGLKASGRYCVK
ncbi:hypothetical protein NAP1_00900 [Erythrobacter sp. NAP1]|uniref:hypothetical protein n=1 Tax=Erythrobacter sp. NAP1 TaxID=237727 RepID=UPI0000686E2F|nr:hypothetical protein [Erythrobacter sp. NAP1]EAQ29286.1 hypothetical protein NAP1_00900 [Erythrobacter sp. NAP1]